MCNRPRMVQVLGCLALFALGQLSFADPATDLQRIKEMTGRLKACGANVSCMEKVGQEMSAAMLATQTASGGQPVGARFDPCRGFPQGLMGRYCEPVTVHVEASSLTEQTGRIYSGALPDPGRPFVRRHISYSWRGEARGGLIHADDYSEYTLTSFGLPETIIVDVLNGYEQTWDSYAGRMDRRNYNTGVTSVRQPFDFGMSYPPGTYDELHTNVTLVATEVDTSDDYIGAYSAGGIAPYDPVQPAFVVGPDQMRGFAATGGFERVLNWRSEEPGDSGFTETHVRLSVSIGEGCADKIHLAINADHEEGDYVFSDDKRGLLTITLKAEVEPAKYAEDVIWTLPEVVGSIREIIPGSARGPSVKVSYEGLPASNDQFGPKQIRASIKSGRCMAQDQATVRLFYFRDQHNNPDGRVPNWFYYWQQAPAGRPGGLPLDIRYGDTDFFKCAEPNIPAQYQPVALPDSIVTCDLKKLGPQMTLVYPKVSRQLPATLKGKNTATVTGIDTFAVAVMHEFQHLRNTKAWKSKLGSSWVDADNDGIPDVLEPSLGFDPAKLQTYTSFDMGGDEEFMAYEAMYPYAEGTNDQYDWAVPGKNFPVK